MMTPSVSTSLRSSAGPGVIESARSSRSLPDRAGASFAALGAALALTHAASAQTSDGLTIGIPVGHVLGPEEQVGSVHPSNIAPDVALGRNRLKLTVTAEEMRKSPDLTTFTVVEVQGSDPEKLYAVKSVTAIVHDLLPSRHGRIMILGYNNLGEITNAPPDKPSSLGDHVPYNPYFNVPLMEGCDVRKVPLAQAFPAEAAADPQFATKFDGFQQVTYTFKEDAMMVVKGPVLLRPLTVLTSPTGNSLAYLPICSGEDLPGSETYLSKRITDENGDPFRAAFPLDPNWRLNTFTSPDCNTTAIQVVLAEVVPETVAVPPPPLATAGRSGCGPAAAWARRQLGPTSWTPPPTGRRG